MKTHSRRLLMCCLLLLILPMAAFAEENELPVEWVRYGHGLPNPASVDAHELTDEAITLEGVAYAPKLENGRVYVWKTLPPPSWCGKTAKRSRRWGLLCPICKSKTGS